MDTFENELVSWINSQISDLPDTVNLAYLEYNTSSNLEFSCSFFGYTFTDITPFDPEDISHLDALSAWEWESGLSMFEYQIEESDLEPSSRGFDEMEILEKALSRSKELDKQIKETGLTVLYGLHDASPRLFVPQTMPYIKERRQEVNKIYYYELHFDYSGSPYIDSYNIYGIDERRLLDSDKIDRPASGYSITLTLQKHAKLKDLLNFYRGWLVGSQRLVDIFKEYTSNLQVFPATVKRPLDSNSELIEGYSVINLYEKIDCIDARWLVKSSYGTDELTFDREKGYKVWREKVAGKDVFRLNVEDYRLLVSQRFRDELVSRKISGILWLKREVE